MYEREIATMEERGPEHEEESQDFIRSTITAVLGVFRAIAIIGAMVFVAAGAVLAFEFFYFVKDIVASPAGVVQEWRAVLRDPVSTDAVAQVNTSPETPEEMLPPESEPRQGGEPLPPVSAPLSPEARSAVDPVGHETVADDIVPFDSVSVPPGEAPRTPEAAVPAVAEPQPGPPAVRRDASQEPWLELADRLLEYIETGQLGWFAGMCFLVVFCWILGKVPVVMLSTGTKVLVDLFKIGSD